MLLNFQDTFSIQLPADASLENKSRLIKNACFSYVVPQIPSAPKLRHIAKETAALLGLSEAETQSLSFLEIFSGLKVYPNTKPYAMCYGGHQFGHWAAQLGDGRATNLGEILHQNKRWAIQLKGAGRTPYSRNADGLAVLRSSIREHLCSEAMFHLGVPTTRSLSLITTGDLVWRDVMYNGNPQEEQGAVVCRVAPSFIRFGNFEIFTARQDVETLKTLTDYTIRHFYPEIEDENPQKYVEFFKIVAQKSMEMVLHWQRIGFVHGVMNTDNMSILGLTIDFGPYGWVDDYDPNWTPNTTDAQHKRYRFGNQPNIVLWNLLQLANALYPLINDVAPLEEVLETIQNDFPKQYLEMLKSKLGLKENHLEDINLLSDLEENLQLIATDMTLFYRYLSDFNQPDFTDKLINCFYETAQYQGAVKTKWEKWFLNYKSRLSLEKTTYEERKAQMDSVNPKYVLRNYMAQLAIDAAENGDYSLIETLHQLLKNPYKEQPEMEKWFSKRPDWAKDKVGCSMLSCSS